MELLSCLIQRLAHSLEKWGHIPDRLMGLYAILQKVSSLLAAMIHSSMFGRFREMKLKLMWLSALVWQTSS